MSSGTPVGGGHARIRGELDLDLAIYVLSETSSLFEQLKYPMLIVVDERNNFKFVDIFISDRDASAAVSGDFDLERPEIFCYGLQAPSLKSKIDAGELVRIGPLPRPHAFFISKRVPAWVIRAFARVAASSD